MLSEVMKRLLQQHWEVWLLQVTFSEIGKKFIHATFFRLVSLSTNACNQNDYETMLKFQGIPMSMYEYILFLTQKKLTIKVSHMCLL